MRKAIIFIVLAFLLAFCAAPAYANGIPAFPHTFYGSVDINGKSAPDGTRISATVDEGDVIATQNPVMTEGGNYGVDSLELLVQGDIPLGATITFYVKGVEAEGQTATFEAGGGPTEMNLTVTIPRPPGGGGIGGGDTKPPRIYDVGLCSEGVTETTVDICWMTNEKSTSQVKYWCNGHKKSDLDEEMVINHHVQLTGLTPGTTYYYKTMSMDRSDNLEVSEEYSFKTLGEAPAAAFAIKDLSISPPEVEIGEEVTISVLVTNTGNLAGSYEVTLKIDGVVEATKEVTLKAGAGKEVAFTTAKDLAGSYTVAVDGLSGLFTVKAALPPPPPPPPPPEEPINYWPLIGGIIAAVVIVGLLVFFFIRRKAA